MPPKTALDKTFKVSIILKGLDGALEFVGGILLFFITPQVLHSITKALTQHELTQDPNDFIANHLLHLTDTATAGFTIFGAIYLLTHGIVKIVLVISLLKNKLWAYPWMIAFLLVFATYQIYRLAYHFSIWLLLLTLFDLFVAWLTYMEYERHKKSTDQK